MRVRELTSAVVVDVFSVKYKRALVLKEDAANASGGRPRRYTPPQVLGGERKNEDTPPQVLGGERKGERESREREEKKKKNGKNREWTEE